MYTMRSQVVCFIVMKGGRFLAEIRKDDREADPGCVVFPGGHIKEGEDKLDACRREFMEEFGLECSNFQFICTLPYTASNNEDMDLHYFRCRGWSGDPKAFEAEKLIWLNHNEISRLSFEEDKEAIVHLVMKNFSE